MTRVACIQYECSNRYGKEERLQKAEQLIERAAGADLIVLPEMWNFGWHSLFDKDVASRERLSEVSETLDGETISRIAEKARKLGCHIVSGSILERRGDSFFNTLALVDRKGDIVGTYSKMHRANYLGYQEAALLSPGSVTTVKTELGTIGFAICYDVRFPELFRKMALEGGAEIIVLVSAFAMPRLENYLHLCYARATENQCYLVSCSGVGADRGHQFLGYTMVIDYRGAIVAGSGGVECVVKAEIDLDGLWEFRKVMPHLQNVLLRA
jgi:predicted amidohydrolase